LILVVLWEVCEGGIPPPQPPPLRKFIIEGTNHSALCNDGTPAVYYFRPGHGTGLNRWVIRLQGGGYCYDERTCLQRQQFSSYWTTSKVCPIEISDNQGIGPANILHGGILSSDYFTNPYFFDSNHVYVWYCSSDAFVGSADPPFSPLGWYFRGKRIVASLVYDLVRFQNLGHAEEILVTGDSSGGIGVFNNINLIWELIAPSVSPRVVFRGFVDSGWFVDIPSYDAKFSSVQQKAILVNNNLRATYDKICASMYIGQEWHCFLAEYSWKYIRIPIFYNEFQMDSVNLKEDGVPFPFDANSAPYVYRFKSTLGSLMQGVPYQFFPNCYKHTVEDSSLFVSLNINRTSLAKALWDWFKDTSLTPRTVKYVDTCNFFNCNDSCPPPR